MTRLPIWLTPHQRAAGRFEANAYPDQARGAVEREPDTASLADFWSELGFVWCPENLCYCWRDSCPCPEVCE